MGCASWDELGVLRAMAGLGPLSVVGAGVVAGFLNVKRHKAERPLPVRSWKSTNSEPRSAAPFAIAAASTQRSTSVSIRGVAVPSMKTGAVTR